MAEHSDKLEAETAVGDDEAMERIIAYLGYDTLIRVNKVRTKTHVGEIEICLDEVEGLGTFIEVERMIADDGDGEAAIAGLEEFLKGLGIAKIDRVFTRGYDVLLYERGLAQQLPV
jgi:adenylate cyclase class 2